MKKNEEKKKSFTKNLMILYIVSIVVSLVIGFVVCLIIKNNHYNNSMENIRQAWYKAAIDAEDVASSVYADDHNNYAEVAYAEGFVDGSSTAIQLMNNVLQAIGEPEEFLCDYKIVKQQILNNAKTKRNLKDAGLIKSVYDAEPGNPVNF